MAEIPGQSQSPINEEDKVQRREGWREFLLGLNQAMQDPVRGQVIFALGSALAKDRAPGQSVTDHLSRAFDSANAAGGRATGELREQATQQQEAERANRQIDLQEQEIEQRGEIAQEREAGEDRRLEAQLTTRERIAREDRAQDDRRIRAQMGQAARQHAERMRSIDLQLTRAHLSDLERRNLLEQRYELERDRMALERAAAGDKTAVSLMEASQARATRTDALGNESVDPVLFRETFNNLSSMLGLPHRYPDDSVARLHRAAVAELGGGKSREEVERAIQATSLSDEQKRQVLSMLPEQGAASGTDGGASRTSQGREEDASTMVSLAEDLLAGNASDDEILEFWQKNGRAILRTPTAVSSDVGSRLRNRVQEIKRRKRSAGQQEASEFVEENIGGNVPGQLPSVSRNR